MHEIQDARARLCGPEAQGTKSWPAAIPIWRAGGDGKAGKAGKAGRPGLPGGERQPPDEPQEKTIAEAFEDLDAEEKQKVSRLVDRITGRKQ